MSPPAKTHWRISGEQFTSCMCAWGCPCQFNAVPTHGRCEGLESFQIQEGYFGNTRLDGARFALIVSWPGPIYEGNGTRQLLIDEQTTPDQRAALSGLGSGTQGGAGFEIFAAVCPNQRETLFAPIALQIDRERRQASLRIPGIGESRAEPLKNPVTDEEHRARIVLPDGVLFKEAEMANTVSLKVQSGTWLEFEHVNTHGQLNAFEWSNT